MAGLESNCIDTTSNVLYLRVGLWQGSNLTVLTPLVLRCISGRDECCSGTLIVTMCPCIFYRRLIR